jgi:hypothetical protein
MHPKSIANKGDYIAVPSVSPLDQQDQFDQETMLQTQQGAIAISAILSVTLLIRALTFFVKACKS